MASHCQTLHDTSKYNKSLKNRLFMVKKDDENLF